MKMIEDQRERQIKALKMHGKQLRIYSNEKVFSTHSKQKEIFEELADKKIEEIQDLSKQIDFNNSTCRYKGNTSLKTFIGFKSPLGFSKSIKESYVTIEKPDKEQNQFKQQINEIVKGEKKLEDQKSAINNIKTAYES